MKFSNGQYIFGKCLGIKDNTRQLPSGDSMREVFCGVSMPVTNGYDGQMVIIDVKMSKAAIESNEFRQFEKYINKEVAIPINPMTRAYNGKAYTTNYFDNRRGVVLMPETTN